MDLIGFKYYQNFLDSFTKRHSKSFTLPSQQNREAYLINR